MKGSKYLTRFIPERAPVVNGKKCFQQVLCTCEYCINRHLKRHVQPEQQRNVDQPVSATFPTARKSTGAVGPRSYDELYIFTHRPLSVISPWFAIPTLLRVMSAPKKIGGEIGDVRANIDVEKLNAYLAKSVPEVRAPVTVKQFKVSNCLFFVALAVERVEDVDVLFLFELKDRFLQFGQVRAHVLI